MESRFFNRDKNSDAEEIKKYLPANVQFSFDSINPALYNVEEIYIKKLLSKALFNKLADYYKLSLLENSTSGSGSVSSSNSGSEVIPENSSSGSGSGSDSVDNAKMGVLLELIQSCAVKLAYWKEYPTLSVMITDSGAKAAVEKDLRLFKYEYYDIMKKLKNDGFDQMDIVINYLMENIGSFNDFKGSVCYPNFSKSFVPTTELFDSIYNINGSRLVFLKLRQYVNYVEDIELDFSIGDDFKNEILSNITEEKYKKIVPLIQQYVVYSSVSKGISELGKDMTDRGVIFESLEDGIQKKQAMGKDLLATMEQSKYIAEQYIAKCLQILKKNISDYPLFAEYIGETQDITTEFKRDNNNKKTFFV